MNRASTVYSANPKRSEGSVPGLKAPTNGWLISPDLNEVRVQHRATGCNVWPGPERSEGPAFNALPRCYPRTRNEVRVRPHKGSGANLKHRACFHCVQR